MKNWTAFAILLALVAISSAQYPSLERAYATLQDQVQIQERPRARHDHEQLLPAKGELSRPDGSSLVYYFSPPDRKIYPILLYLDGSSCGSATRILDYFKPFLSLGLGTLTLEKRGVLSGDSGDHCSKKYFETNDRHQRVGDTVLLLSRAKRLFPGWDGRLIVVGGSEGGTIAPEVAASYDKTAALISFAGGGWSQSEELKQLKKSELLDSGASPKEIEKALADLEIKFDEIRRSPVSTKTWMGKDNTYKRWASYLWYSPLEFLVTSKIPVYVAHGTRDTSAPVQSADAIEQRFKALGKPNLTYRRYEGLDHDWKDSRGEAHAPKVIGDLLEWLRTTIPVN